MNGGPRGAGPHEARGGGSGEAADSHPVTVEVAVSFLEPGDATYFPVTRMPLQHWDGRGR